MYNEVSLVKALLLYGSPRNKGNTYQIVQLTKKVLKELNIQCNEFFLTRLHGSMCIGCDHCLEHNTCIYTDDFTKVMDTIRDYEIIVISTPVYFGGVTSQLKVLIDRMQVLYNNRDKIYKKTAVLCISTAAEKNPIVFEGIKRTLTYVSYSLGAVATEYIVVNNVFEIKTINELVDKATITKSIKNILIYFNEI